MTTTTPTDRDWTPERVAGLFERPFADLLYDAQRTHRRSFDPNVVQLSTLLNIKTGACPEDCAYCPQSVHHAPGRSATTGLMDRDAVLAAARAARDAGATRFCMGAAWRQPRDADLDRVAELVAGVRALGLETCVTLGMLDAAQARRLRDAGLDYYNHNIDTSASYYPRIISTRTFQERLDTLAHVQAAGIHVCCGGIIGMGESRADRAAMIATLAGLSPHPDSVPINRLVPVPGTPLEHQPGADPLEFVRTIAVARITMPRAVVRLSAGRDGMDDAMQALCFLAGANSIFFGDRLLTTGNPDTGADRALFDRLGIRTGDPARAPA